MAQNLFGTLTNPSLPLLDANFTQLFNLRDYVTTPEYTAAAPKLFIGSAGLGVGINPVYTLHVSRNLGSADISVFENIASGSRCGVDVRSKTAGGADVILRLLSEGDAPDCFIGTTTNHPFHFYSNNISRALFDVSGNYKPTLDNTSTLGASGARWNVVYAATGSINTSDAREKSDVLPLSTAEINAACQLTREIGSYRWLAAIRAKGDSARLHIGMTVQRAIDVLIAHGLDPMAYGFICYDQWPEQVVPARTEQRDTGIKGLDGEPIYEATVIEPERSIPAGDRYSFRHDELLLFIARGFEARLSALEAAA